MNNLAPLESGDLVEISSWRKRGESPILGVIVEPIMEASVPDFSKYAVLINDEIVSIRRDMIQKIRKPDITIEDIP